MQTMVGQPPRYPENDLDASNDTFLLNEGLDLLDQFRSIRDQHMRKTIYLLLQQIVIMQTNGPKVLLAVT
jgi:hypothetical protein